MVRDLDCKGKVYKMEKEKSKLKWDVKTRLSDLLFKESMSDVIFVVGDPPKKFHCHKVILGAGCQVFERMLYGKIPEKSEIRVPDVTASGFVILLRYLYTDAIAIENESDAFEAAYVAKKYMIPSLFNACEDYLLNKAELNSKTVFALQEEASFLEMKRLQDLCLRYVSRNAKKIFRSGSFTGVSKTTFQDILCLDFMDIDSECEIIEALWLWGTSQCKELGIKSSRENVRNITKDLLKYIRFLTMNSKDLEDILEKFQLLDTTEQIAVLWNIAAPRTVSNAKMPSDMCSISRGRSISNCSRIKIPTEYKYDGNISTFPIQKHRQEVTITVTGPQMTIIGLVVAFKPIPCYSSLDRCLDFKFLACNNTTKIHSSTKMSLKAMEQTETHQIEQELVLDEFIVVSEGDVGVLSIDISGEGVRLMQCMEDKFSKEFDKTRIKFSFEKDEEQKLIFPIKEIMCM